MEMQKVQWCGEAATSLKNALGHYLGFVAAEVKAGDASLWRVPGHGYLVTRLETFNDGKELVLVAFEGKNVGEVVKHVTAICKNQPDIKKIRFHTAHPENVVSRLVNKWGFKREETVYYLEF